VTGIGEPYRCWVCGGTFTKTCSDEEAKAEQAGIWQPQPGDDGIVCDDCFQQVMAWAAAEHPEYLR
jgi:hypothetical protein